MGRKNQNKTKSTVDNAVNCDKDQNGYNELNPHSRKRQSYIYTISISTTIKRQQNAIRVTNIANNKNSSNNLLRIQYNMANIPNIH